MDKTTKSFPPSFFFPHCPAQQKYLAPAFHTCRYFSAPRCTEFLKHINSSFGPNLTNHSPTRSFLNGGVPLTRYSLTGTLKKNEEYNLFIRNCKYQLKPLCFSRHMFNISICWSSADAQGHDLGGFQNDDHLRCIV